MIHCTYTSINDRVLKKKYSQTLSKLMLYSTGQVLELEI